MYRVSTWYVKNFVVSILIVLSLSAFETGAWAEDPCPAGACRFLGFDDELALSMHNNSSQNEENYLGTYVGKTTKFGEGVVKKNPLTNKDAGTRVVSSVTVTGKMTVDPATSIKDEVFTVSIVEVHKDGEPDSSKVVVNRFYENKTETILNKGFDTNDNTESRIGAATGNLTGDLRDEIAIAYENSMGMLELLVLRNEDMDTFLEDRKPMSIPGTDPLGQGKGIAVTSGNFDGDAYDEIAVLYEIKGGVELVVYKVQADQISYLPPTTISHEADCQKTCRRIGVTAGDFDGDDLDELLTATIDGVVLKISYYEVDLQGSQLILKDRIGIFTQEKVKTLYQMSNVKYPSSWGCPDLRLISADLEGDGKTEGVIAYRKTAWFQEIQNQVDNHYINYGIDLLRINAEKQRFRTASKSIKISENHALTMDIVARSNFDGDTPGDDIICATLADRPVYSGDDKYLVKVFDMKDDENFVSDEFHYYTRGLDWDEPSKDPERADQIHPSWTFSIAAGEFDGDGQKLGDPKDFRVKEKYQPVLVLQTPPQHIDVFEDGVSNISYFVEFNSQFDYEEGASQLAVNRSTAEYGNGFYSDAQIGMNYGRYSFGVKTKTDAMWKNAIDTQNSVYQETALASQLKTTVDDLVRYNTKEITYWRYPVPMGADDEFLQFTLPNGDSAQSHTASGSGLEYYQPEHENGNLLSYPWFQTLQKDVEVLNTGQINEIGEGNLETSLALSSRQAGSVTETTGHTLQASAGVYMKAGTQTGEPMGPDISLEAGYQHDQAVQHAATSETSTTGMEKISIHEGGEAAELLPEQSYAIQPLFFREPGGPIQVSYTVDPDSLGSWWYEKYAELPDPALNLPDRWKRGSVAPGVAGEQLVGTYSYLFNTDLSRHRMKSFFVFYQDQNEAGEPIGEPRQVWGGEVNKTITLRARIYNYSMKRAPNVKVQFQYQVYDGNKWSRRKNIVDAVSVGNIPAWGNARNRINWKWAETEFTPATEEEGYYCFWVIVDPGDKIQELPLHDNRDRYSNNAGYWGVPFPVYAKNNTSVSFDEPDIFPPNNIVPEFGDFKRDITIFEQGNTSHTIKVDDNGRPREGPREETEPLMYTLIHDTKTDESWIKWSDTQTSDEEKELFINPVENFIVATDSAEGELVPVTIFVSNAITFAETTIQVRVLSFVEEKPGDTTIEHWGARPASFMLGMQNWECTPYTQELTDQGDPNNIQNEITEITDNDGEEGINAGWITLAKNADDLWELFIDPTEDTAFWHTTGDGATRYATRKLIIACNTQEYSAPRQFDIIVANNVPTLAFDPPFPESNGLTPFKVRVKEGDGPIDKGDTLTYTMPGEYPGEEGIHWITFDPDTQTLSIKPRNAGDVNWTEGVGYLYFTQQIAITADDGGAQTTKSVKITIQNTAPSFEATCYQVTRDSLQNLQEDGGISGEVVESLEMLTSRPCLPEREFSLVLQDALKDQYTDTLKELILEYTNLSKAEGFSVTKQDYGDDEIIEIRHAGSSAGDYKLSMHKDDLEEPLTLTYKFDDDLSLPEWLSFDPEQEQFTIKPIQGKWEEAIVLPESGGKELTADVDIEVWDGGVKLNEQSQVIENRITQTFRFILTNTPPAFQSLAGVEAPRNQELAYHMTATDNEADQLAFSVSDTPAWLEYVAGHYARLSDQVFEHIKEIHQLEQELAQMLSVGRIESNLDELDEQLSDQISANKQAVSELEEKIAGFAEETETWNEVMVTRGPTSPFNKPRDVALGSPGGIYITDTGNRRILLRLTKFNGLATVIVIDLSYPCGVAVEMNGTLYIADAGAGKHGILTYKADRSPQLQQIAGTGESGYNGDAELATQAKLNGPRGVAVDSTGNVYIADTGNHRIRKLTPNGSSYKITTIAGTGESGYNGDDKLATQAKLDSPMAVAVDSEGNVYIADTRNHRIRKLTRNGSAYEITTIAGTGKRDYNGDDKEVATDADLNRPNGVDVDSEGNVYIADTGNDRIRKLNPDGKLTTVFEAESPPYGIAFHEDEGAIYIAERENNLVRKIPLRKKEILEQKKAELELEIEKSKRGYSLLSKNLKIEKKRVKQKQEDLDREKKALEDAIWASVEGSQLLTESEFTELLNDNLEAELLSMYGDWLRQMARASSEVYLRGTPGRGDGGDHTITISVSDGIATTTQELTITVPNESPVFTTEPVETAILNQEYSYIVEATDADRDPLKFRRLDVPTWLESSGQRIRYRLTPESVSAMRQRTLTNLDVGGQDPQDVENLFSLLESVSQSHDFPFRIQRRFFNNVREALNELEEDGSAWVKKFRALILEAAEREYWWKISGIPTVSGPYPVVVAVDDGAEAVEQRFVITVGAASNQPPRFTTEPPTEAIRTVAYTYEVKLADDDGDTLFFWANELPDWLPLSQERTITKFEGLGFMPRGIAIAADGKIYATDVEGSLIWTIDTMTSGHTEIFADSCENNGFWNPMGIAVDGNNAIFVADSGNKRICRCTPDGTCSTLVRDLKRPFDVAITVDGRLYIADTGAGAVYTIGPTDSSLELIGDSTHWTPYGLAVDRYNNVYVSDVIVDENGNSEGNSIEKLAPDVSSSNRIASLFVEEDEELPDGQTGEETRKVYGFPRGLAVDSVGNLYVADETHNRIQQIAVDTAAFTITSESPVTTITWDADSPALLDGPSDVTVASDGSLYIADTLNKRILRVDPPQWILAGTPGSTGKYAAALSVFDWTSPPVSQSFEITVDEGQWVTFRRGFDQNECSGKYWVDSWDYACETTDCAAIKILWQSETTDSRNYTIYTQPSPETCQLTCVKQVYSPPVGVPGVPGFQAFPTPTPTPAESVIKARPGDTFSCYYK